MGHGRLLLLAATFFSCVPAWGEEPMLVRSQAFEIEYQINEQAQPIESVALWYTTDQGENWFNFGSDEDRQSPIGFRAEREGLYGFYLVAANAAGASGAPPHRGTMPHFRALVDFTSPVVQLHSLRQVTMLGQRTIQIRWTAIDANFTARPLTLEYRVLPGDTWRPISREPLINTGRFDWRPPDDLVGAVAIRATVRDRVGHSTVSEPQTHEMTNVMPVSRPTARLSRALVSPFATTFNAIPGGSTHTNRVDRVAPLFAKALAHRDRGEYREGIARLREVVRLDPASGDAFVEMGDMLYHVDDLERALQAYDLALRQQPMMRRALRGAALIHRRNNEHEAAAERLRTILQGDPNDAEVWINLGDLSIFQGAEVRARECYTRASLVDPTAIQVIADARERLQLMATVSRTYAPDGR